MENQEYCEDWLEQGRSMKKKTGESKFVFLSLVFFVFSFLFIKSVKN
jgi:hypothetical protein